MPVRRGLPHDEDRGSQQRDGGDTGCPEPPLEPVVDMRAAVTATPTPVRVADSMIANGTYQVGADEVGKPGSLVRFANVPEKLTTTMHGTNSVVATRTGRRQMRSRPRDANATVGRVHLAEPAVEGRRAAQPLAPPVRGVGDDHGAALCRFAANASGAAAMHRIPPRTAAATQRGGRPGSVDQIPDVCQQPGQRVPGRDGGEPGSHELAWDKRCAEERHEQHQWIGPQQRSGPIWSNRPGRR